MSRSAHEGSNASQSLAARPSTGHRATQCALNSRCRAEMDLNSGVANDVTTGWGSPGPCSVQGLVQMVWAPPSHQLLPLMRVMVPE
jgi:hypothetical protein